MVTSGHRRALRSTATTYIASSPPYFQAGHASSILVTRSTTSGPSRTELHLPNWFVPADRSPAPGHSRATSPRLPADPYVQRSGPSARRLAVENELNNRPKRVLNDRSPAELYEALLTSANQSMLRP